MENNFTITLLGERVALKIWSAVMILIINFFSLLSRGDLLPAPWSDMHTDRIAGQPTGMETIFTGKCFRWLCCSAKSNSHPAGKWIRFCCKMFSNFNFTSSQFCFFSPSPTLTPTLLGPVIFAASLLLCQMDVRKDF